MFRLFSIPTPVVGGLYGHSRWVNTKARFQTNYRNFLQYYENTPIAIGVSNPLYKIIMAHGEGHTMDYPTWYRYLVSNNTDYAVSIHLTSSGSVGKIIPGGFFGPGISEVLISIDEPFDPVEAAKDWKEIRAVRILQHPRSDLNFGILNGSNKTDASGFAVLTVNIPLLMVQYKAFRDEERLVRIDPSTRFNPMQFIHMFVLPKLIYDQIDYALLNRFYCKVFDRPVTTSTNRLPFYLTDWSRDVDEIQWDQLRYIEEHTMHMSEMLQTLRCTHVENQAVNLELPKMFQSRQVLWALAISRFTALEILLELDKRQKGNANRQVKNNLRIELRRYSSDQLFSPLRQDHRALVRQSIERIQAYL